jgi:hypothetical protein
MWPMPVTLAIQKAEINSKPAQANSSQDSILKKTYQKKGW